MRQLPVCLLLVALSVSAQAATQADADAALTSATLAEAATPTGNRWIPTEAALKAAKAASAKKDWDEAVAQATKARALALRSKEQSREQETSWRAAIVQ